MDHRSSPDDGPERAGASPVHDPRRGAPEPGRDRVERGNPGKGVHVPAQLLDVPRCPLVRGAGPALQPGSTHAALRGSGADEVTEESSGRFAARSRKPGERVSMVSPSSRIPSRSRSSPSPRSSGFTLIEIVIVMAMLGFV